MDFVDVLSALKRRWLIPVVAVVAALLLGFGWMALKTPMYKATSQVFVSSSSGDGEVAGAAYQGALFAQNRVATYAQLVTSPEVLGPVATDLGLTATPQELAEQVSAVNQPQTVLLEVTATSTSAAQAAALSNAAGKRLADAIEALETPSDKSASPIKVTVTKPATPPAEPYSPNPITTFGLAGLLGLALGVGLALLREQLDTTIKSSRELTERSGATPLGVVGYDAGAEADPLAALNPQSPRSEAFRTMRTNLSYTDVDNPPKVVAITSSVPGEGKSTAACNLAITLAQAGLRVCLVEADLRRPRVAEYLGIDSAIGLTDVLAGKIELSEALLPWNRDLLTVLPCGAIPPNPSELLASDQMRIMLAALRQDFDGVIMDAAPLLPVADGAITASIADGAILMVRYGKTTTDQLDKAIDALGQVDARLLGTVLNYAPSKKRNGYGYGYGESKQGEGKLKRFGRDKAQPGGVSDSQPGVEPPSGETESVPPVEETANH